MAQNRPKQARGSKPTNTPATIKQSAQSGATTAHDEEATEPAALPPGVTPKQALFIDAYLTNGFNQTQAAITAGYAKVSAHVEAHKVIRKPAVRAEIDRRMRDYRISADEIMGRLSAIARANIEDLIDDNGNLDFKRARQRGALAAIRSITQTVNKAGDVKTRIELHNAQEALKTLGHAANVLRDNLAVAGAKTLAEALGADDPANPLAPFE
jgi:phage terminase small subunit